MSMTETQITSIVERLCAKALEVGTVYKYRHSTTVFTCHQITYTINRKIAGLLFRGMNFWNFEDSIRFNRDLSDNTECDIYLTRKSDTETNITCFVTSRKRYRTKLAAIAACKFETIGDLLYSIEADGSVKDRLNTDWSYANAE